MFLLFAGASYYPGGGWRDFVGFYPTLEDALVAAANAQRDWWHVATFPGGIIRSGGRL